MSARIRTLLLTAITALVVAVAAGPASAASTPGMQYRGVQLHSLWSDSTNSDMDRELDMSRDMGANVVRVTVGWDSLETGGKGQYSQWYVDKLDRFVAGASARGMKVLPTLTSTPCWASSAPDSVKQGCSGQWWNRNVQLYAPSNPANYGDAAKFITGRYGSKLAALEVWNEPNMGSRFLIASDKAAAYASILKAAYPKVKQANADLPVLAGALAYQEADFVNGIYRNGIKGYYDGISMHPYNDGAPSSTSTWSGIKWIRDLQRANGDDAPLWITEFGWSTCKVGSGWCMSQQTQAQDSVAGFAAMAKDPNIKAGIVYNLRDTGTQDTDMEQNFGLVSRSYQPKPAYNAIKEQFRSLDSGSTAPVDVPGASPVPAPSPAPVPATPSVPTPAPVPAKPAAPAPAKPVAPARPGKGGRKKLSLKVKRQRGLVKVSGKAPRGSKVELRTSGCRSTRAAASAVRRLTVGASGRFIHKLGKASALAGCRVQGSFTTAS